MGKKKASEAGATLVRGKKVSNQWVGPAREEPTRERVDELQRLADARGIDIALLTEEVTALRSKNQELEENNDELRQLLEEDTTPGRAEADPRLRDLWAVLSEELSLPLALRALAAMYPDRLVVLPGAHASAERARQFEETGRACQFMLKFATDYWAALRRGEGDAGGLKVFGKNVFSAKESETVEKNKGARVKRTFVYLGKKVEMMKHLKIGTKESDAKTWRMHFLWDAAAGKLVIGHCGGHLDHH